MSTQQGRTLTAEQRDRRVLDLYDELVEVEQRLIPTGLHVFGRPSEVAERADMLRMVASFDRPEAGVRALPDLVSEKLGFGAYYALLKSAALDQSRLAERERVDAIVSDAIREFREGGESQRASFLSSSNVSRAGLARGSPGCGKFPTVGDLTDEVEALLRR